MLRGVRSCAHKVEVYYVCGIKKLLKILICRLGNCLLLDESKRCFTSLIYKKTKVRKITEI